MLTAGSKGLSVSAHALNTESSRVEAAAKRFILTLKSKALPPIMLKVKLAIATMLARQQSGVCGIDIIRVSE